MTLFALVALYRYGAETDTWTTVTNIPPGAAWSTPFVVPGDSQEVGGRDGVQQLLCGTLPTSAPDLLQILGKSGPFPFINFIGDIINFIKSKSN